jgi:hypothetical protein
MGLPLARGIIAPACRRERGEYIIETGIRQAVLELRILKNASRKITPAVRKT